MGLGTLICDGSCPVVSASSSLCTSFSVVAAAIAALMAVACSGVGPPRVLGSAGMAGTAAGRAAFTCREGREKSG